MKKEYNLCLIKVISLLSLGLIILSCAGPKITTGINDAKAPTNTSIIYVQTDLDAESAYKKLGQTLQNRGYTFRSTNETLMSVSTEFIGASQTYGVDDTFVRIGANVQGESNAKIVIRGWFKTLENENTQTGQTIKKFGQNRSAFRDAWKEMYQVADSLGGTLSFK